MPIYEYRCENGHLFEVMQKMTDGPVTDCEVCGAPVQRVFHPIAVHFKGSGFYNTDYGTARRKRETAPPPRRAPTSTTPSRPRRSPRARVDATSSSSTSSTRPISPSLISGLIH